jgi:hypothetical protein
VVVGWSVVVEGPGVIKQVQVCPVTAGTEYTITVGASGYGLGIGLGNGSGGQGEVLLPLHQDHHH